MTVNLVQSHTVIGIFNCQSSAISYHVYNLIKNFVSMFEVFLLCGHYFESAFIFCYRRCTCFLFYNVMETLNQIQDRRKLKTNNFSVCHWNLNSLSAHSFSKLTELKAYNSIYKNDFICLSKT